MKTESRSSCRICNNFCAIRVEHDDGTVLRVRGDAADPVSGGYTCVKGRSQGAFLSDTRRLLRPLRRRPDGEFEECSSTELLDEIAERLIDVRERHGPDAIAGYAGTMAVPSLATAGPFYGSLLRELGTRMSFDPNTIDKGGKQVAADFLGRWQAPAVGFHDPDVILLIGTNPLVTYTGFPAGSPAGWLRKRQADGCRLVVVDPRTTETARRADLHIRPRAGHDVPLLLAMLRIILEERRHDVAFVEAHVTGVAELRSALEHVRLELVAEAAGVAVTEIETAARWYADGPRGYAMAGTGPHMSGQGTVVEYLVLVLETLCGRWMRAGDQVPSAPSLIPHRPYRAQATPPRPWRRGDGIGVRALHPTAAGMPTAALPELIERPGGVRALISWGGNPAVAFPDQRRTVRALESLELFVQIDPWMSESARLATHVIAPTMPLETPSTSVVLDWLGERGVGYGASVSYANVAPAVVPRPDGADVLDDWEIFFELLSRLGGSAPEFHPLGWPRTRSPLRFDHKPTTWELVQAASSGGCLSVDDVVSHAGGLTPALDEVRVLHGDQGHVGYLNVGNAEMLRLAMASLGSSDQGQEARGGLRLVCRRHDEVYNTSAHHQSTLGERPYNPVFMNPGDMERRRISDGVVVTISTAYGRIFGIAEPDSSLRVGIISMAFGFGRVGGTAAHVWEHGSSPNALLEADVDFDPYTGQPLMSNVPVEVEALHAGRDGHARR